MPRGLHRPVGGGDDVFGQLQDDAALIGSVAGGAHLVEPVGLDQAVAHRTAVRRDERERHGTADQQRVDTLDEGADRPELVETLAPPSTATYGRAGSKSRRERVDLALEQPPGGGGPPLLLEHLGERGHGGVGPVHRAERVVDVVVGEIGEAHRERAIVRLLPRVEAEVLEQDHPAGFERESLARLLDLGTEDAVRRHVLHHASEQLRQQFGDRAEAQGFVHPAMWPTEVRRGHDRRAPLEELGERRHARSDPGVVGDHAVGERDVQIQADEDAPSRDVAEVVERSEAHRPYSERPTRSTRSTRRFEYPHSLSYQPTTLATLPMTMVAAASKVHDAGFRRCRTTR